MLIRHFLELGKVYTPKDNDYLLAEGIYDSPNHYLRLRMFLLALKLNNKFPKLLGVLLNKKTTKSFAYIKLLRFSGHKIYI